MIACHACAADNPDGSRFCNQCGTRLSERAPTVDAPRAAAGYTPRHLVERVLKDRSAMIGERKRVTVLFADIKGSTRLAEQAGAEAWHGILDRFFGLLAAAVHRYEGTINQYTGDGVMALFGAPVAHEDHAERACHAALDMQSAVREFADALRLERGLNLTLRIGLNTGEVVVGRIGDDLRMDYTAQGATVNLAARLEQICEPGQVYLSRATAIQAEGPFSMRSLGATRVNGVERPVEVFALEGRGQQHGTRLERRLADGGASSFFFGREPELARLQACLADAVGGRGRVVALVGPAGIGKSRLCHEFLASAAQRGVRVHRAAASPFTRHAPMAAPRALYLSRIGCEGASVSREQIRACVEADIPEPLRAKPGALAFAMEFCGVGLPGELNESLAAQLREPMMRILAEYLPKSAEPQILLFEDLHHLDAVTMEFARQLVAAVAGTPTLLLLSWRGEAQAEGLPDADETLSLGALSRAALTRLAGAWLGAHPTVAGLDARIAERAGGNPYFVEEAVVALAETGDLEGGQGDYRLVRPVVTLPIPDTVHALIAARIDRLPAGHKRWLQAASVVGAAFDESLLGLLNDDDPAPGPALDALERAGFLRREGGGRRFAQPLVREVAYEAQLESSRSAMHARVAAALEHSCGDQPVQASARSIAEHWARAGEWAKAGRWNLHAALWFSTRDARITAEQFHSAVGHLDRAPFSPEIRRLRIGARSGLVRLAQLITIDPRTVDRAYEEARQLADECGDPVCAAELSISYGNAQLQRGHADRAAELVEAGVRGCPDAQRADLASRFRLAILLSFGSIGRLREGLDLANWATGDEWLRGPIRSDTTLSRAFVSIQLAWNGELRRACEDLDTAIGLAERDGRSASWMHGVRVEMGWFSGDSTGVLAQARLAMEQAESFGSPYFRVLAQRAMGQALNLLGRPAEALVPLSEALPHIHHGGGAFQFEAHHLAVMSESCIALERFDDAARHSDAAVASAQASGARLWELRAWLARLALPRTVLGDAAAREGFERARALVEVMQAAGVTPRLDELEGRRCDDVAKRNAWLRRAHDGYERIGAGGHAARLRPQLAVEWGGLASSS
jgi:adenylate cyclase